MLFTVVVVPFTVKFPEIVTFAAVKPVATSKLVALIVGAFSVPENDGEFDTDRFTYPPASS